MIPEDAWKGNVRRGDRVRVIQTGKEFVVGDLIDADVHGTRVNVIVSPDLWYDISEVELC